MPATKKELVAEARKRNIYSREFLGKPVSSATKQDLTKAIKNDKERKRRKLRSMIAKGVVAGAVAGTFGAGAVELRKAKRDVQRARGAERIIEKSKQGETELIDEMLEQIHELTEKNTALELEHLLKKGELALCTKKRKTQVARVREKQ